MMRNTRTLLSACASSSNRVGAKPVARNLTTSNASKKSTVDPSEIAKFSAQADKWWNPEGSAAPLHRLNPVRIAYIRSAIEKNVLRNRVLIEEKAVEGPVQPLAGIELIDVGCGGGVVAEPMARLGAKVLGIDMSKEGIIVARNHAKKDPSIALEEVLQYRESAVEDVAKSGENFDVVLALEIVEHVAEPAIFIQHCASLVRPGGILILSTLNRTVASYVFGIFFAERILRWLPPGTHEWQKFPTPEEVADIISNRTPLTPQEVVGLGYNPLRGSFAIVKNTDVNYILTAVHAGAPGVTSEPKENSSAV